MAKRQIEPLESSQINLLARLSSLGDLWTLVLSGLVHSDVYMLKIVTKALKPCIEQFLASLGPLCLLAWQCVKRCGHRSYQHCCGLGITQCVTDIETVPLQMTAPGRQYIRYVVLDALTLRSWRFYHGTECNIQLATARCPNWGSGSTNSREYYWLDEVTGTLSFLEDWNILPSSAVPRAHLCWTKDLDRYRAEEMTRQRTASTLCISVHG